MKTTDHSEDEARRLVEAWSSDIHEVAERIAAALRRIAQMHRDDDD